MNIKADSITEGAYRAVSDWVSDHRDVTMPDAIIEGAQKAVAGWLEKNGDELQELVALSLTQAVAKWMDERESAIQDAVAKAK